MLELIGIYKTYDKRALVLKDINLVFNSKAFVSIVGPSGCGKTTLLNIVGGLDKYTSGNLIIDNINTTLYKEKDWDYYRGNKIGFIFQDYNLIPHLTVYENLKIALSLDNNDKNNEKDYDRIITALKKVGLENHINKYPRQLSGGEGQRVAIARAIVTKPSIILADEPTGALDSVTSVEVMKILKEISQDCLVIMVTHNELLANKYSDRIIRLVDGQVVSDSNPAVKTKENKPQENKKTSIPVWTAVQISFKNLINKKLKTSMMIVAGTIGIIGLSLVLIFSDIVNNYMIELQKNTLAESPITINSTVNNVDPDQEDYDFEEYPNEEMINITNLYRSYYDHVNKFDDDFLYYFDSLDDDLYNIIDYKRTVNLRILTKRENKVERVYTSRFTEVSDDLDYLATQYDVLAGKLPTEVGEIAILVDKYNNIDLYILKSLGIDYQDSYSFSEIMKKEYRVVLNNDAYTKNENNIYIDKFNYTNYEELFNNSTLKLKISGIVRPAKKINTKIYGDGILYSKKLTEFVVNNSNASDIVQEQLEYGLTKNVATGLPFIDIIDDSYTMTKDYVYQNWLETLGASSVISSIRIYTDTYRSRIVINDYIKNYNNKVSDERQIRYYDYMGSITREFDAFISVLTKVLIAFAAITLFVATIMVTIITYISVLERIKEIGILRSLGARRKDVGLLFIVETALIGFVSGVLGITGGTLFLKPIINVITKVMEKNDITTFDLSLLNLEQFNKVYLLVIVLGSVVLMMIAGVIPALIAAFKKPVEAIKRD